ncbi:MAG: amino acid adenylation domain-containing protein, partial [Tumebacillaceae bacterium]
QQHLDDIAFTLMFGRIELEERFACIASSTEQLAERLERFLADQLSESCQYGIAAGKKQQRSISASAADDLNMLAASWVQGEAIEWEPATFPGQRVSLPGYPFDKLRCWFEQSNLPGTTAATTESKVESATKTPAVSSSPQPEQPSITVSHQDPIVRDHVVQNVKLLPGVGYLEVVRRARASRDTAKFSNLYWLTPAAFLDEPREIQVIMQDNGFTVKTGADTHCQGTVQWNAQQLPDERIDIAAILERCPATIGQPDVYRLFEANGLSYGSSFRVIDRLHWNDQEAVAKVDAGNGERGNAGILDGGLQTAVGLSVQNGTASDSQYVPYCAESFHYADNLADVRYYYVKQHPTAKGTTLQFDVYYCDEQGKVLAVMHKFVKRAYAKKAIHYYTTRWREEAGVPNASGVTGVVQQPLLDNADEYAAAIAKLRADNAALSHLIVPAKNPGQEDLRSLLLLVQTLIRAKFKQPLRILYVLPNGDSAALPFLYAAGGLARTLKYEYPRLRLEVVSSDGDGDWNAELQYDPAPLHEVMYRGGKRYLREVVTIDGQPKQSAFAFRQGGVYLLAGGTGGLGQIFAAYLAKNFQARLILLGRRTKNADIDRVLKQLEQLGGSADYLQADIGNEAQLTEAVATVRTKYGQINGVIQGGGIIEDSFILRKPVDSFDKVLQPKIQGTVHLDRATASDPLDFFVMFSSVASLMPNQGQCDYAAGNSFIDHFAQYRRELAGLNKRSGITVAINWPLWANGGMQVTVEEKEHLLRVFGMQPLGTEQGLVLFGQALQMAAEAGFAHILGIEGDKVKINHHFKIEEPTTVAGNPDELLPQLVLTDLCKVIAQAFRIPLSELDAQTSFGDLGVDSISILNMTHLVNQYFGIDFKPTLLFEYETPQQIVDYMLKEKRDVLRASYANLGAVGPLYRSAGLIDLDKSGTSPGLYQRRFDNREFYMVDHVVEEQYNVPGACFIEMARQAGALDQPGKRVVKLTNNYWAKQLSSKGDPFNAYIALTKKEDRSDYTIYSLGAGQEQVVHATGTIRYEPYGAAETEAEMLDLAGIRRRCVTSRTRDQVYAQIHAEGLMVGPTFMPMQEIVLNEEEALATLVLPEMVDDTYDDYLLHPTTLTGVFQTAIINNRIHGDDERDFIPIAIESIEVLRPIPRKCLVYSEVSAKTKNNPEIKKFNVTVCDETGLVVAKLTNFALKNKATSAAAAIQPVQQTIVQTTVQTSVQTDFGPYAQQYLRELLAPVIGIDPAAFRADAAFEKYGINSVMILELNKVLEDQFGGELSKTLFFEYRNLSELADYFLEEHREVLGTKIRLPEPNLTHVTQPEPKQTGVTLPEPKHTDLTEMAQNYIKGLLAPVIGIEPSAFKPQEVFEKYGINSVMILELNKILEDQFGGELSKTLFFEYRNLAELAEYFLDEHRDVLAGKLPALQAQTSPATTAAVPAPVFAPSPVQEAAPASAPAQAPVFAPEPAQAPVFAPAPVQAPVFAPAPVQVAASAPAPVQAPASVPAPVQAAVSAHPPVRSRDIAIIGVAGRYPHADTLEQFWNNLWTGRDSIEEVPSDRFDCQLSTKWGSFINDVDKFDPVFFNIPPRAAEAIDPQERLFLQTAWHAMEDAGYTRQSLEGESVGVFVGALWQPYLELGVLAQQQGHQVAPSTLLYSIANRVSYFCNFSGPSFTVDTACSSSLTALHLACQSIQYGESGLALVGGVNLSIGASKYMFLNENNFLSSDGRCRSFGAGGDGYVPGEGVGAVLLKPLDRAVQDGDHIYGVIKGTAINHGGKTNGYTVPNPTAQTDLILKALEHSQVDPRAISYIEAHGTGTALGDPIELTGLTKAFSKYTREKQYCAIGSVKSNIGHLEAAAGIAGLTKVLLQMKHGRIAPSLHSQMKNPNLDFRNTPFFVPQELTEWKRPQVVVDGQVREYPRIAGISSFGAGGSNAHVIIEEYIPSAQPAERADSPYNSVAILLSAKNRERLEESAMRLIGAIRENRWTDADLPSIAYTLQVGREVMEERLALLVGSIGELEQKLEGFLHDDAGLQGVYQGHVKRNDELAGIFDADEDLQEAIEKWVAKRKYAKLLGLWVKGLTFNWELAYGERKPRRMSLPTYPFARERYWLADVQATAASSVTVVVEEETRRWREQAAAALEAPAVQESVSEPQTADMAYSEQDGVRLGGKQGSDYTQTERNIAKIWADVLGYREINVYDTLFDLGADSISMMKLAAQLSTALNADVTLDRLMKYSSVTKLAEFVASGVSQAKQITYPSAIIDPASLHEPFSLTDVQMAYWMGRDHTYELGGVSTHIYFEYETQLDIARLSQSLQRVIDRHPMLRSVVLPSGEQQILDTMPRYEIQSDDVLAEGEEAVNRKIEEVRGRMSHHVSNPEQWPLFDFHAVKTSADSHRLFVSVDMLIADGSSYDRIAREMLAFYHDPNLELPKLDITFRDYMNTYMEFKRSETYLRDREYWMSQLPTFPSSPALPLMASPAEVGIPSFTRLNKMYPKDLWDRAKAMARRHNVTPTALLATAYASVLAYWSNQSRLAVNLTVFNRFPFHEQIDQLVGDFTSIMLLGVELDSSSSFWDRTRHVQSRMLEALEHRHYDGIEFIREYTRYHGLGNQAAMPVVFTSMLQGDGWNAWSEIGEQILGVSQTPQVILDHQAIEIQGELMLNWDYVDTLFDEELINKMFDHYTGMLEAWMAEEEAQEPSLPEPDRAFIEAYNQTAEAIPAETLHGLFLSQAARTPQREAVRFGDESLSYEELDRRSNQVARYLLERGVGRNDLIGVFGKRHPSTIVSILGILKAGAAYVPVDPDYPEDRVQYILSNSACKVFLGEGAYETEGIGTYSTEALDVAYHPEDLAYVIYTSGSTGRPKGVVITHQAAANTVQDMNRKFAVTAEDRMLGISSLCFDLSVYDIFGALAAGAALVQIADQRDVRDMIEIVERERISIWNSVPAILDLTVDTVEKGFVNTTLRVVLLSGDKIPLPLPDKVKKHFTKTSVISLGGATEASIWSIYYPVEEVHSNWKTIPYGKPLANQTFYVLNPQLELCPVGVQGELYIGGIGLAQGYLNDEEKTKAAFFIHPTFGPLYKTGDHGVWRPEGHIEFLGRIDHQVKIRGYRVELGEIETTLMQHPSVKNATVIDRTDAAGKKYLCAYIVPESDVQSSELREHLGATLPDYMVPSHFVTIEAIPLTPNGKVDRKALPEPEVQATEAAADREARNETEAALQAICQDVMGMERVSVTANFFELGMNSVLMVKMINRIGREMNAKIAFRDFVRQHSIEELATYLASNVSEAKQTVYPPAVIDRDNMHQPFGLTDVQMAYLMGRDEMYELGGTSTHVFLEYETDLEIARLSRSLQRVIDRHPMLRAVFLPNGEQQILSTAPRYEIQVEDLSGADEATVARKLEEVRERMAHHVFDPEQWPLFEFHAVKTSATAHRLFVGLDALISDGSSFDRIAREMMAFYQDEQTELPELDITFRDYINSYKQFKNSDTYQEDRAYWLDQLDSFPSAPALPLMASPAEVGVPTFTRLTKTFPKSAWDRLKANARRNNVTSSALIATAYASVLAYWSNQQRLAINLTVFNRFPFHEQIDQLIGDFTSIMLLGIDLNAGSTLWDRARHVQDRLMEALEHRHYDGIEFIREYSRYHGLGNQAAMPVAFTSMLHGDALDNWAQIGELQLGVTRTSQVTLDHQAIEFHGDLLLNWDYVDSLFDPELIEKMFAHYTELLEAWMAGEDDKLPSLPQEDRAFIEAYNQTSEPIPAKTLHGLFLAQAARTPEREAVRLGEESLSYEELDRRSNQVARYLMERSVGRNDLIGVLGKRHPSTIVSILG